ncbi:MAG: hypothetical protein H7301_09000 [Cryobacterium sp.]|nr:hypothetical protein [Oligoflexia bacterium]
MRATRPTVEANRPLFFARLVDEIIPHDRIASLSKIEMLSDRKMRIRLALVGSDGTVIFPSNLPHPFNWAETAKPGGPMESTSFGTPDSDPPEPNDSIIRPAGSGPAEYLLTIRDLPRPGPLAPGTGNIPSAHEP